MSGPPRPGRPLRGFLLGGLALLVAGEGPQARPAPRACAAESGARRAADLLRQCRDVSPEARTACLPTAPCAVLADQIRRACRLAGDDAPNLCGLYPDPDDDEEDEEG